jgi:lysophospholipase L1-like esterase
MTNSVEHEGRSQSANRHRSASLTTDTQSVWRQPSSAALRFLSRCIFLLGYALVSVLVLASCLEFLSWIICTLHPLTRQAQTENQKASPVYAGANWAPEFWREEAIRRRKLRTYVPFRLWGVTEWHSRYINNDSVADDFWRRTINPANCPLTNSVTVWTFGGSTMYGSGVPDWATIPSYLSRELNAGAEHCLMVYNFGVEGYVTAQELILLEEQLTAGGHPDMVIFYDGINDSMAQCPPGPPTPHGEYGTIKSRVEGSLSARMDFLKKSYTVLLAGELWARFLHPRSVAFQASETQPRIMRVMSRYEGNMRVAQALADAYRFKLYSFWQPLINYGHKPLVSFEQRLAEADASAIPGDRACILMMAAAFGEAEHRSSREGNFVFLGSVFDSTKEPTYIDQGHLGPRGNEVVAQAIAHYVRDHPGQPRSARSN